MAVRDTEAFLRQRASLFDANLDVSPGAPFDVQVIQPLVRRLGQDPFTVDLTTFINDRITQAFPDLASKEGDAITDLLNKPASILWDPIVREIRRTQRSLSFQDPATLTLEEADALGANLFSQRRKGDISRGVGRILFTSPQNVSVSPVNFFTSRGGLHFFPVELQSIRTQEMLLNVNSEGLYYFDINLQAEKAGTSYNIGPNQLVSVANIPAAVRVQNLRRFRFGQNEETAVQFVGRTRQSLSERSLVTLRGAAAKILDSFPDVNRLNLVGFNDPEMQRDLLTGGGLGSIVASGTAGVAIADSENKIRTRRFFTTETDFTSSIIGDASSFVLTVFGATGAVVVVKDFDIERVVGANEIDLKEQDMILGSTGLRWTLRKRELTLSGIPGGILFPDSQNGTVDVPDNQVHIGGAYDVHVRGTDFEESTLAIDNVTDDEPLLFGAELDIVLSGGDTVVQLQDYVLGVDYEDGDDTHTIFSSAELFSYTLQILEGVDAGNYRITAVSQTSGQPAELTLDPVPTNVPSGTFRWRLFDQINIDLVEPKETRISGSDLRTVQGTNVVDTSSGINFNDYGVAEDDVLRILSGPDAGDYAITAAPLSPSFDKLQLDSSLSSSQSDLDYLVFRPNAGQGVLRPFVRITSIELLDGSRQPLGSTIPYARPVDAQSRAFQNPARGIKHDIKDAILGLVSKPQSTWISVNGLSLEFVIEGTLYTAAFTAAGTSLASVISELNAAMLGFIGVPEFAVQVGSDRFGIRPVKGGVDLVGGSAFTVLFGLNSTSQPAVLSTFDIRSDDVVDDGGFDDLDPAIDLVSRGDVLQILDGVNAGFYEAPYTVNRNVSATYIFVSGDSDALVVGAQEGLTSGFAPEIRRRVQIGARSLGSARVYFLEPTSFEVDDDSRFILETDTGDLRFLPDPTLSYQRIPALPDGDVPTDGVSDQLADTFSSASQDFVRSGIQVGDKLVIENIPLEGSIALADPVAQLVNKTFIFSLDGGPDRTLTFIRNDVSLAVDEVGRQSVVDQINAAAGETICSLTSSNTLRFQTNRTLVVRYTGTANGPSGGFSGILGDVAGTFPTESFVLADQSNESSHARSYTITSVGVGGVGNLTVSPPFGVAAPYPNPVSEQTFKVYRQGLQRISTTAMAENEAEAGLYYFDVELVSEGAGDAYNIASAQQLLIEGYRSDGYYLETGDTNLTFSPAEELSLVLSRTVLENGVDDDPSNATQLSSQNIQITYERSPLVEDVQNYISSDVERVICANPLSRHLVPVFVRFDMTYVGGSRESVIVPEIEQYVRDLYPVDALESSDVQKIALDRGATSISNPLDLIGIVHRTDRTVYAVRSQNAITAGRLSAFVPDVLNITRNTT